MEINIDKILKEKDYKEFLKFVDIPIREKFLVKETLRIEEIILKKTINQLNNKENINSKKIKTLLEEQIVILEKRVQRISRDLDKNQKEKLFEKYINMYMNHLFCNGLVWITHTEEEMKKTEIYDEICFKIRRENLDNPRATIIKADYAEDFSILCSNDDNNRITSGYLMIGSSVYDGQDSNNIILNSYLMDLLEGKQVGTIENYYINYMSINYIHLEKQNTTRARNINKNLYTVIIGAYQNIYNTLKDEIYKIYHNGYTEEELKKAKEERQSMYESLFIAKDFLESKVSREKYCSIKSIQPTFFDKAIENLKQVDEGLYKEVGKQLNKGKIFFLNQMNEIGSYLKRYDPRKNNFTLIDYYAITNRPIEDVISFYRYNKEILCKAKLFKRANEKKMISVNYKEIDEAKIIIIDRELTQEDKDNIKNFIKKEGYPNIKNIYLEARKAYLEGDLRRVEKETIKKLIKNKFAKEKENKPNEQKQKKHTKK